MRDGATTHSREPGSGPRENQNVAWTLARLDLDGVVETGGVSYWPYSLSCVYNYALENDSQPPCTRSIVLALLARIPRGRARPRPAGAAPFPRAAA